MPKLKKEDMKDLKSKYQAMINREFSLPENTKIEKPIYSREYKQFKRELYPKHFSLYEKLCNWSAKIMPMKPDKKNLALLIENIQTCHLNITPGGVMSFSIILPLLVIIIGGLIGYAIPFLLIGEPSYFFVMFFLLLGGVLLIVLQRIPDFLATQWRMKSSNQMILSVFYVVTFMRHTSNLEGAVRFAADHLSQPLSLDFRKILWDVETEKFSSVSESVDRYLENWKKYNIEFVEAFHLIQGSLFESSEQRRLSLLDKSLEVILEGTYDKMLHFAHNLNAPITMLHMLGVILPVLGLVILPLIVSFMTPGIGMTNPENQTAPILLALFIATLYNITLPLIVYFMGQNILAKRPPGYGEIDISNNPELKKYKNFIVNLGNIEIKISPLIIALLLFIVLFSIGISPILVHKYGPVEKFEITRGSQVIEEINVSVFEDIGLINAPPKLVKSQPCKKIFCFLDYKFVGGYETGPYGGLASILSVFVVLSAGLSFGIYYKLKSKNIIKIRNKAKELEKEFAAAIFQLGNRLGDGFPAEIAFGKVASTMQDTVSGKFMKQVSENITRLGMGVEQAIFDKKHGALVYFPSNIIQSSMKVLVQSIKKGPKVAAQALISISQYIKEIRRVEERLKDLLADVVSSMKSQISFLAPSIAGIVIAISSMISVIINNLAKLLSSESLGDLGTTDVGGTGFMDLLGAGVPPYYFQIIVGLYVVQIVFILTILINNILNGSDKLNEKYLKGKNLIKSTILYCLISLSLMIMFNYIAYSILGKSVT